MNLLRTLAVALVCAIASLAQVNPALAPFQKLQFSDVNGVPYAGGLLYSYAAGTTNPQATYSDNTLGTALSNPIVLDSAGRPPQIGTSGAIWLAPMSYKFVLENSASVVEWTVDNISDVGQLLKASLAGSGGAALIGFGTSTVAAELGQIVYLQNYGAVCDAVESSAFTWTGTDNQVAVRAAIAAVTTGGGTVKWPHAPLGTTCGVKGSIVWPSGVSADAENSGQSGLVALVGGTFSTYYHQEGSHANTTFLTSIGGPNTSSGLCAAGLPSVRVFLRNIFLDGGNGTVQTVFHTACAQENTGLDNFLISGCTLYCADVNSLFGTQNFAGFHHGTVYRSFGSYSGPYVGIQYEYANSRSKVENVTISGLNGVGDIGLIADNGSNITADNLHEEELGIGVKILGGSAVTGLHINPDNLDTAGIYISNGSNFAGLDTFGAQLPPHTTPGVPPLIQDYNYRNGAILSVFAHVGVYSSMCLSLGPPSGPCTGALVTDAIVAGGTPDAVWVAANPLVAQPVSRDINATYSNNSQVYSGYLTGINGIKSGLNAGAPNAVGTYDWLTFTGFGGTHTGQIGIGDSGMQCQELTVASAQTVAGGGCFLWGSLGSAIFGSGMVSNGVISGGTRAESATPSFLSFAGGSATIFADTGQTVGAVYTPTAVITFGPSSAFAGLGTGNQTMVYCTDCKVTSSSNATCTASGTGDYAFRIAGVWKCLQQ